MEMTFFECPICGQIIGIVKDTGAPLICCGLEMERLIPGSADASVEKHVPVIRIDDGRVTVAIGSAPHPMTESHFIEWIALETKGGNQRKALTPGSEPEACFRICEDDEVLAAYAFCNLHGLWKAGSP